MKFLILAAEVRRWCLSGRDAALRNTTRILLARRESGRRTGSLQRSCVHSGSVGLKSLRLIAVFFLFLPSEEKKTDQYEKETFAGCLASLLMGHQLRVHCGWCEWAVEWRLTLLNFISCSFGLCIQPKRPNKTGHVTLSVTSSDECLLRGSEPQSSFPLAVFWFIHNFRSDGNALKSNIIRNEGKKIWHRWKEIVLSLTATCSLPECWSTSAFPVVSTLSLFFFF